MQILPLARSPGSSVPAVLVQLPPRTAPAVSWHQINLDLEEENLAAFQWCLEGPAIQGLYGVEKYCKISILLRNLNSLPDPERVSPGALRIPLCWWYPMGRPGQDLAPCSSSLLCSTFKTNSRESLILVLPVIPAWSRWRGLGKAPQCFPGPAVLVGVPVGCG